MYSNILVGNKAAAENIVLLAELGVTHLLNCAGIRQGQASSECSREAGYSVQRVVTEGES